LNSKFIKRNPEAPCFGVFLLIEKRLKCDMSENKIPIKSLKMTTVKYAAGPQVLKYTFVHDVLTLVIYKMDHAAEDAR